MERVKQNIKKRMTRRTSILLTLLGLLVISSYANYRIGAENASIQTELPVIRVQGNKPTAEPTQSPIENKVDENSFAAYRTQRVESRAQEIRMLDEMIADNNAAADTMEQARLQKLALVRSMEQETTLEGLLKAKGFEDVLVSARSGSITVVIKQESLTSAQATQILEMATRETGEEARNVKIIPTK